MTISPTSQFQALPKVCKEIIISFIGCSNECQLVSKEFRQLILEEHTRQAKWLEKHPSTLPGRIFAHLQQTSLPEDTTPQLVHRTFIRSCRWIRENRQRIKTLLPQNPSFDRYAFSEIDLANQATQDESSQRFISAISALGEIKRQADWQPIDYLQCLISSPKFAELSSEDLNNLFEVAVHSGHIECIHALRNFPRFPEISTSWLQPALKAAIEARTEVLANALITCCSEENLRDFLHVALERGDLDYLSFSHPILVRTLMLYGVDSLRIAIFVYNKSCTWKFLLNRLPCKSLEEFCTYWLHTIWTDPDPNPIYKNIQAMNNLFDFFSDLVTKIDISKISTEGKVNLLISSAKLRHRQCTQIVIEQMQRAELEAACKKAAYVDSGLEALKALIEAPQCPTEFIEKALLSTACDHCNRAEWIEAIINSSRRIPTPLLIHVFIQAASRCGCSDSVKTILQSPSSKEIPPPDIEQAFVQAAHVGSTDCLKLLLSQFPEILKSSIGRAMMAVVEQWQVRDSLDFLVNHPLFSVAVSPLEIKEAIFLAIERPFALQTLGDMLISCPQFYKLTSDDLNQILSALRRHTSPARESIESILVARLQALNS